MFNYLGGNTLNKLTSCYFKIEFLFTFPRKYKKGKFYEQPKKFRFWQGRKLLDCKCHLQKKFCANKKSIKITARFYDRSKILF
jgi:hypothetical protein